MPREIPPGAALKDISAHFNHLTIPRALQVRAPLPPQIWGRLVVEEGSVRLMLESSPDMERVTADSAAVIPRDTAFSIGADSGPARFYLEYYHEPLLADGKALAGLLGRSGDRSKST